MKNLVFLLIAAYIAVGCGGGGSSEYDRYAQNLKITDSNKNDIVKSYKSFEKYEYSSFYRDIIDLRAINFSSIGSFNCVSGNYSVDDIREIDASNKEYIVTFNNCKDSADNLKDGKLSIIKSLNNASFQVIDENGYKTTKSGIVREYGKDSTISHECTATACYLNIINLSEYSSAQTFGTLRVKNFFLGTNYEESKFKSAILFGKLYVINQNRWVDLKHKDIEEFSVTHCPDSGEIKFYGSDGTRMYITYSSGSADIKVKESTTHYDSCTNLPTY